MHYHIARYAAAAALMLGVVAGPSGAIPAPDNVSQLEVATAGADGLPGARVSVKLDSTINVAPIRPLPTWELH